MSSNTVVPGPRSFSGRVTPPAYASARMPAARAAATPLALSSTTTQADGATPMRMAAFARSRVEPLLDAGRIGIASQAVGIAQAAYEWTLEYLDGKVENGEHDLAVSFVRPLAAALGVPTGDLFPDGC